MPLLPGEELTLTVFADVHYYLNPPGSKPQHERFVRGVYVYFFHNPVQRRSRLELANHAGTPDQDAIDGYLDSASINHDRKQPNLVTLSLDAQYAMSEQHDRLESPFWRLVSYDLRHENKYSHRVHSMDLYFWNTNDSSEFMASCRRLLQEQQLKSGPSASASPPESSTQTIDNAFANAANPVVQQLEQVAITDGYRPRASTASTVQSHLGRSDSTGHGAPRTEDSAPVPPPAPYNPARPGMPETFSAREKTPPPIDAATGTGLTAAATMEHPSGPAAPTQQYPGQSSISAYQTHMPGSMNHMPSSGSVPLGAVSTISQTPRTPNLFPNTRTALPPPPFSPTVTTPQYAIFPQIPHDTPLQSPDYFHTPLASPSFAPPPSADSTPDYTYKRQDPPTQTHHSPIHQQFYRPTQAELAHGHSGSHKSLAQALGHGSPAGATPAKADQHGESANAAAKPGKFETRMSRLDKSANRWIKKIEKV